MRRTRTCSRRVLLASTPRRVSSALAPVLVSKGRPASFSGTYIPALVTPSKCISRRDVLGDNAGEERSLETQEKTTHFDTRLALLVSILSLV